MCKKGILLPAAIFLAGALTSPIPASAQDYVVMGTPLVNLRTGPSTDAMVIGRAQKGDVFKVVGVSEDWYQVLLFSGEPRYVVKADFVYPLGEGDLVEGHGMHLPTSTARSRSIWPRCPSCSPGQCGASEDRGPRSLRQPTRWRKKRKKARGFGG
jgi:hypothetical protein